MGKMKYIKPEVEIIEFEFEGVIASSNGDFAGMDKLPSEPGTVPDPVNEIWDDKWL